MNPTSRLLIGCALAVVVPAALLHFTAASERLAAGLSAAPFAWPRVLVAHLVTALPLGFIVTGWLRSIEAINDAVRGLWLAIGLGIAGLATLVGPPLGDTVSGGEFGAVPLLVLRTAFAFALVLPWCVWATDPPVTGTPRVSNPGVLLGLGVGLALLPCGLYADAVVAARTEHARDLMHRERIVRADAVLTGLVELGSDRPIGKKLPAEVRKNVVATILRLRQAGDRPFPATAKPVDRFNRAVLMIQLDRLGEASAVLQPLVPGDDVAALLLATVYRDQERWAESDELFALVLEKLLPRAATDPAARGGALTALEGLAFNARADRRPADAESALNRGLEALPTHAAYFHFQLGRHYHDGGRPGLALEHLREAARLDPVAYAERVDQLVRQIQTSTHACMSWRSR